MAPLFQRRSLLIRDDEPDYSVRAGSTPHTHIGGSDVGTAYTPPIWTPIPPPLPPVDAPASRAESSIKRRLDDLTDHALDFSRQLKDAGKSRIASIASRLAKNLAPSEQFATAMASNAVHHDDVASSRSRQPYTLAEEQRWLDYEASLRDESPLPSETIDSIVDDEHEASPFPVDHSAEILRMRAERVLTEVPDEPPVAAAPEATIEPGPETEAAPVTEEIPAAAPPEKPARKGKRGKYGALVDNLDEGVPHNWNGTSEESAMREESAQSSINTSNGEARARSVTLDSDSNTINITKESRFSGQLKFSGTLVIDGEVEGELDAVRIVIREGGTASARISGDSILISGKVTGDVVARRELEMTATGKLNGDIITPELKLQPGAVFKGRCSIGER